MDESSALVRKTANHPSRIEAINCLVRLSAVYMQRIQTADKVQEAAALKAQAVRPILGTYSCYVASGTFGVTRLSSWTVFLCVVADVVKQFCAWVQLALLSKALQVTSIMVKVDESLELKSDLVDTVEELRKKVADLEGTPLSPSP